MSFRIASMPSSRAANYCLGYFGDSVFIDFNNTEDDKICLKRISFDGYGCCSLDENAIPMTATDSKKFKEIYNNRLSDLEELESIIKKTLKENLQFIWEDALVEYELI